MSRLHLAFLTCLSCLLFVPDPGYAGPAQVRGEISLSTSLTRSPIPRARPAGLGARAALPRSMTGLDEVGCLQMALYHEARGEGVRGQEAVASVILNRVRIGRWGDTICDVVSPVQFSFVRQDLSTPPIKEPDAWDLAGAIARAMLAQGPLPELSEADHFHTIHVAPGWRRAMIRIARIGDHVFYDDPASESRS